MVPKSLSEWNVLITHSVKDILDCILISNRFEVVDLDFVECFEKNDKNSCTEAN